jgi:hypothetical protein
MKKFLARLAGIDDTGKRTSVYSFNVYAEDLSAARAKVASFRYSDRDRVLSLKENFEVKRR